LEGALSVFEFTKTLQSHQFQEALGELEFSDEAAAELVEMLELDGHVYYEEFIDALGAIGQDAKATQLFALKAHVSEELNQIEQKMASVETRITEKVGAVETKLINYLDNKFETLMAKIG